MSTGDEHWSDFVIACGLVALILVALGSVFLAATYVVLLIIVGLAMRFVRSIGAEEAPSLRHGRHRHSGHA